MKQTCTICGAPSIPGLIRGHGKCQMHWTAGVWGEQWAATVHADRYDSDLADWKHQKRHLPEFESDAPTCRIQWIDKAGNFTPDNNPAVCEVRCDFRISLVAHPALLTRLGAQFSEWFPCCTEHAKRLADPGMQAWERRDL